MDFQKILYFTHHGYGLLDSGEINLIGHKNKKIRDISTGFVLVDHIGFISVIGLYHNFCFHREIDQTFIFQPFATTCKYILFYFFRCLAPM